MNTPVSFSAPQLSPAEQRQVFKAVHSAMVEKPSSFTSYIEKRIEITIPDIEQLCEKIHQYFSSFDIVNHTFESEVSLSKGAVTRSGNIIDFKKFDESQSESVESISINIQYMIISPRSPKPISFSIELSFKQVETVFLNALIEVPEILRANIIVHIEHADYIIAKSLVSHIESWAASLVQIRESRFIKISRWFLKYIDPSSRHFIGFGSALASLFYFLNFTENLKINDIAIALCFFVCLYFLLTGCNILISRYLKKMISSYSESTCFNITKGDTQKIRNRIEKNTARRRITSFLFGVFSLNVIMSFFAAYLFELCKPYLM